MSDIIEVQINGQTVYFESDEIYSEEIEKTGGLKDIEKKTSLAFERALETIKLIVSSSIERIRSFDETITPDEFQLEFGVKLSGEYGAVVTKVGSEAQLIATFTYKHKRDKFD